MAKKKLNNLKKFEDFAPTAEPKEKPSPTKPAEPTPSPTKPSPIRRDKPGTKPSPKAEEDMPVATFDDVYQRYEELKNKKK